MTSTVEAILTEQDSYFARFLAVMASNHTSMNYNSSGLNTRRLQTCWLGVLERSLVPTVGGPSLVNQTAPFPSTGCIASPARECGEGRVWPLLQGFRGAERNVDMTNEIRVVTCIANYHVPQIPQRAFF